MAFANISFTNTFADWLSRFNQILYVINAASEGNMNTSGSLTITNISGLNGNVSLNVANGLMKGDGGLLSNIQSSVLTQNSINVISNTTHLSVAKTNLGRLGSTVYIDTGTLITSVSNTSVSAIASANVVNTVHGVAVGAFTLSNTNSTLITSITANTGNALNTAVGAFNKANINSTLITSITANTDNALNTAVGAFTLSNTNSTLITSITANTGNALNTAVGAFNKANNTGGLFTSNVIVVGSFTANANAFTINSNGILLSKTGSGAEPYIRGTVSSGTITPSPTEGNFQTLTVTGSVTIATPTNTVIGNTYTMLLLANVSGGSITLSGFNQTSGKSIVSGYNFIYITKMDSYSHVHVNN